MAERRQHTHGIHAGLHPFAARRCWMFCLTQSAGVLLCWLTFAPDALAQYGSTLNGVGPVARSMAGTTTAAPLDTLGALQWNPATLRGLPNSVDFGTELLFPRSTLSTRVNANALGAGIPPITLAGSTDSEAGVYPLPEFGLVHTPKDSAVSYGIGMLLVGGFGVNYPGSATNPLLTPPPPVGLGVGPVFTQYQIMQVIPTIAVQVDEQLSIGFSPIINLAGLNADPGIAAAPDNANGNGFPTYPPMNHGEFQWGAGFQLGAFYDTLDDWQLGASFRSTQWFKEFEYNSFDQNGAPRSLEFGKDAPMIVSLGAAYTGFDRWLLALDTRYLNYSDTDGYSEKGFAADGAVAGLGWKDMVAVSAGTQYLLTDAASLRFGYSWNSDPFDSDQTFYNVGVPLLIEHGLYAGASCDLTDSLRLSLAWSHFFENSSSGPIQSMAGPIPGTLVRSDASADSFLVGVTVRY
jgi:long-chain fatty acid transport protein